MKTAASLALVINLGTLGTLGTACTDDDPPTAAPDAALDEGFVLAMEAIAPAGQETWKCQISVLPYDGLRFVHAVQHAQTPGIHHMDVMVLLTVDLGLPPGSYDCAPLYAAHPKLMEETTLYASQAANGDIVLPPGVAAAVPGGVTVMQEIHYVNSGEQDEPVFSRIEARTIEQIHVTETIWGEAIRDTNLNLPPQQDHDEWTRCVVTEDIDLLFLSSHTHALGRDVHVFRYDGHETGEEIYVNTDWSTPLLAAFETPLHLAAGEGLEFRCHFFNDRDEAVTWGFSARDEMCQIAIVFTPGRSSIECQVVETSDGVL